jgi:hypothetical protein
MNKIFQIGFNKCGTLSFHNLFEKHSKPKLKSIHWDFGKLAYVIQQNLSSNKKLLTGYEEYDVFTDMECCSIGDDNRIGWVFAFKWFYIIDQQYPNSKFILNTRHPDNWISSRLKHVFEDYIVDGYVKRFAEMQNYKKSHMSFYRIDNENILIEKWKDQWNTHIDNVIRYFKNRPNDLLVFDVEKDRFSKIEDFFFSQGLEFNTTSLPHDNKTKDSA